MYKYIIEATGNFNWMAIFALITFFFIFSMAIVIAIRSDKKEILHMSNLPLDEDSQDY